MHGNYFALDEYLIDRDRWHRDKAALIERAQLQTFVDPHQVLAELDEALSCQYGITNANIHEGKNPYIKFKNTGFTLSTPNVRRKVICESVSAIWGRPNSCVTSRHFATGALLPRLDATPKLEYWRSRIGNSTKCSILSSVSAEGGRAVLPVLSVRFATRETLRSQQAVTAADTRQKKKSLTGVIAESVLKRTLSVVAREHKSPGPKTSLFWDQIK